MEKRELLWKKESLVIRSSAILLESYQYDWFLPLSEASF